MWHDHTVTCNEGLVLFWDQFLSSCLPAHVQISAAKEKHSALCNMRMLGVLKFAGF